MGQVPNGDCRPENCEGENHPGEGGDQFQASLCQADGQKQSQRGHNQDADLKPDGELAGSLRATSDALHKPQSAGGRDDRGQYQRRGGRSTESDGSQRFTHHHRGDGGFYPHPDADDVDPAVAPN